MRAYLDASFASSAEFLGQGTASGRAILPFADQHRPLLGRLVNGQVNAILC